MATDNKDQSGFPFGGVAVALLLAIGIIVPQLELESTRPTPSHVKRDHYPYIQNVPARLWEDPFEASTPDAKAQGSPTDRDSASKKGWRNLREWIAYETGKDGVCLTIMPVTVFGGPFGEYAEVRRRTRYAVVSALLRSGFEADDNENIGYIEPDQPKSDESPRLPKRIPFEWFERKPKKPLVSNTGSRCEKTKVESVLVLWLDEDTLAPYPIKNLSAVIKAIIPDNAKHLDRTRLIGPAGSTLLKSMIDELAKFRPDGKHDSPWFPPFPLEIYAWGATSSNTDLAKDTDIPALFAKHRITLLRPIPDDHKLIDRLSAELELRGVCLATDYIALVSESETFYGAALTDYLIGKKRTADPKASTCAGTSSNNIINFNYLRGLDGETARSAVAKDNKRNGDKDAKRADTTESAGLAQLDYVRRIATTIRERHDTLRAQGSKSGIKAIGIFGTDFYDKSLLLQALKKEMPQALFFTTDLDARMTDANQSKWSRNLVVVSGFGQELRPELQGPTAPFRDNYQTAAYFSTLLAANVRQAPPGAPAGANPDMTQWLHDKLEARSYEVGRRELFDFGSEKIVSSNDSCELQSLLQCRSLSPEASDPARWSGRYLHVLAIFFLATALILTTSWWIRRTVLVTLSALHLRWMRAIAFACAGLLAGAVVLAWHDGAKGEPFRWAEGISVWPTLMLRFVAILLMIYFFFNLWQEGKQKLGEVLARFFPGADLLPPGGSKTFRAILQEIKQTFQKSLHGEHIGFSWSIYRWIRASEKSVDAPNEKVDGRVIVRQYLALAGIRQRLLRIIPTTFLYISLGISLIWLWDFPNAPVRGQAAMVVHYTSLVIFVLLYSLLLFCVIDAVKLFEALIRNLMGAETKYPESTNNAFVKKLGMDDNLVSRYADDWIDIQFIAERTESTARLVYYPFIILAIGLVSRSQIFDNWHTPASLGIIFLIGAVYAAYSAYSLRKTAENAREEALSRMTQKLIAARGDTAVSDRTLKQLELMFEDIKNERRGAFLPLSQQPFWKALLLPLSGFGGVEILQYLLLVQK